jgi:hypothetical protein
MTSAFPERRDPDMIDRREYGNLEAQVAQLTRDVHQLKTTVAQLREMMLQAQGGWRAVLIIGGIASTLGAAITWAVSHIKVS